MMDSIRQNLIRKLQSFGQEHLLRWWESLDSSEQALLAEQLQQVDFELVNRLFESQLQSAETVDESSPSEIAERVQPPGALVRLPSSKDERNEWDEAVRCGRQVLASGKVGVILVAGGQGTRLGFMHPKGMYPIGSVSGASLFQLFAEQVRAWSQKLEVDIPYYIMTSESTHDETVGFFEKHAYFGLKPHRVRFFQQGTMPAVNAQNGKILLATRFRLSTSPDGHGGMLAALDKAGLIEDMRCQGIQYLFYHQVDNPTAKVCDPAMIGFHVLRGSEMTTKVVAKRNSQEKMGVVVNVDGQTQIIEYSDLSEELADAIDPTGQLRFWAGNMAIHVFDQEFLSRVLSNECAIPFHLAHKQVPCIDERGELISPSEANAVKFERFIFDALPLAKSGLVVEADRAREFNPVKNRDGNDSPITAQRAMTALFANWLEQARAEFPEDAVIEISPLYALDAEDVVRQVRPGRRFSSPIRLS